MRLGLNLGYWAGAVSGGARNERSRERDHQARRAVTDLNLALAQEADRLGYAVVWAAEAYGSDAPTVLSHIAAHTDRIDIGSAVMQIPARTPATTAMTAATLDALSGGRFRLGLGVSGPQVSEGWHGVRFDKPLGRTREYVDIVRKALRRERLTYDGQHWQLPLPDGPGKALRLTVHPVRKQIPIYLAAVGPRNLELAGEIADGWLAVFFSPAHALDLLKHVQAGRTKAGYEGLDGFDVVPTVPVVVGDDPRDCAELVRPYAALYIGGMGSREQNFYNQLAVRMGFDREAAEIQDRYLSGEQAEAAALVPFDFIDQTSLLGSPERIAAHLRAFADAGVTTLSVQPFGVTFEERVAALRTVVAAVGVAGLGE